MLDVEAGAAGTVLTIRTLIDEKDAPTFGAVLYPGRVLFREVLNPRRIKGVRGLLTKEFVHG